MRKNIFTLFILFMITASYAQFTYGPKLGGNMSRLSGDKTLPGFQAGGFVNARLEDRIGLQVEFLWTLKGNRNLKTIESATVTSPTSTLAVITASSITTTKTYYRFWDVPICAYFPISKHIRGFAGPQISVFIKAKEKASSSLGGQVVEKNLTSVSGKLSFCAGFDLTLDSPIIIGVRFVTNSFTQSESSANPNATGDGMKKKLNCVMLNVAYKMDW